MFSYNFIKGVFMKFLIESYVRNIECQDIINFGRENEIVINNDEAMFLKELLNDHLSDVLEGNDYNVLQILKERFDGTRFDKMKNLYLVYKEKYKNYL